MAEGLRLGASCDVVKANGRGRARTCERPMVPELLESRRRWG